MVSREHETIMEAWGQSPQLGSRGRAPEAERLFALSQPEESANLS